MNKVLQHIISDLEATKELYVSFYIKGGDTLIPDEITHRLGIKPLHSYAKGDKTTPRKGNPPIVSAGQPWGLWRISTKGSVDSVHVEDHFQYLLNLLEPRKEQLDNYLSNPEEYAISFRIWRKALGTTGQIDINSSYLRRICQLCHTFTFHYVGIEEEVD